MRWLGFALLVTTTASLASADGLRLTAALEANINGTRYVGVEVAGLVTANGTSFSTDPVIVHGSSFVVEASFTWHTEVRVELEPAHSRPVVGRVWDALAVGPEPLAECIGESVVCERHGGDLVGWCPALAASSSAFQAGRVVSVRDVQRVDVVVAVNGSTETFTVVLGLDSTMHAEGRLGTEAAVSFVDHRAHPAAFLPVGSRAIVLDDAATDVLADPDDASRWDEATLYRNVRDDGGLPAVCAAVARQEVVSLPAERPLPFMPLALALPSASLASVESALHNVASATHPQVAFRDASFLVVNVPTARSTASAGALTIRILSPDT